MTSTITTPAAPGPRHRQRGLWLRQLWRGRPEDPRWVRLALLGLLAVTAVLYLWGLGSSGWANAFYSAAVQAGSESWKASFFGSFDAANSITVDKTPASLWVMALSARLFGLNAWSILVPQALMGVASVAVLHAAVRRRFTPAAGLIAGAVLALTPVAALMFRFNNPDALLVLLMVAAAYAVLRAVEDARASWLLVAGVCLGFGFLTKMLQAFLVLPALALAYLVCAPTGVWRRIGQLLLAGLALVVSGGWWIAVVELWPAASRPYIGGSQNNSVLELTLGYNGLGRLNGEETGSVGPGGGDSPGGPGGGMWGDSGISRLLGSDIGGHIAWLLPAALLLLVAGLWFTRRAPRTDAARSGFILWGGWLITHVLVFSYMQGIFHQYYTVALAPAIAALVGMGATVVWTHRRQAAAAGVLAAVTALTAVWSYVLLGRAEGWYPWLRYAVLGAGVVTALGLLVAGRLTARLAGAMAAAAVVVSLAGPTAYTLSTVATSHSGSIPTAGPRVAGGNGPRGGEFPGGPGFPGGEGNNGQPPQMPGGQGQGGQLPQTPGQGGNGQPPQMPGGQGGVPEFGAGGGMGGLIEGSKPSSELVKLLEEDSDSYTWVAATTGSQSASGYQLATSAPVMPVGGFNGTDPSPTVAQFKRYVENGRIHYFIGGGSGPGGGSDSESQKISSWVEKNYTAQTIDGTTVYDLTKPKS